MTICLFICSFLNPFQSLAQKDKADSIFHEFEQCLSLYFKKEFKKVDTSYMFFYGNKFNLFMDLKTFDIDGGRAFVNDFRDALDSSHLTDTNHTAFFYRGMSFKEFLNYIIAQKTVSGGDCILRKVKGVQVFVDCPDEVWQHFYFDRIIYREKWSLTPAIDIFKSDGMSVQHSRYILLCSFTPQKGFKVIKKYLVKKNTTLCTD